MLTRKTADLFQLALTSLVAEVRTAYNEQNIANLYFHTTVSGRTTGDLSVSFSFSTSSYGGNEAKSHDPVAALEEILRRNGWSKNNSNLLLSYSGDEKVEQKEGDDPLY